MGNCPRFEHEVEWRDEGGGQGDGPLHDDRDQHRTEGGQSRQGQEGRKRNRGEPGQTVRKIRRWPQPGEMERVDRELARAESACRAIERLLRALIDRFALMR